MNNKYLIPESVIRSRAAALHANDPLKADYDDMQEGRKRQFGDYVGDLLVNRDFSDVDSYTGQADGAFMDWFCEKLYCGDDDTENQYHLINREWHEDTNMWRTKTAYEVADDYFDYLEDGE